MSAPATETARRRRVWLVLGALMLGMLLASLDQTIVSTALPTIVGDLGGGANLSWVVTAYLLASTASTPLWGKLGDLHGRKLLFQAAIVLFLVGSALCGVSRSMPELISFRALQGLGGGGLIVGAQAAVGDVVSPRERGRYQGVFGAVFAVSSVAGPLLGGFLVERVSWPWIFYVNLPLGALALVVTAAVLPDGGERVRRVIDYGGTALIAAAAVSLVLFTSLGGTTWAWGSGPSVGLAVAGLTALVGFGFAERHATEPVIPPALLRDRTFVTAAAVGFVVGFAMFGAITFLPLYLQVVVGVGPTESGLRMLPMMGGVLLTSIGSGRLITRWGRYTVFPVVGTAVTALGLFLLSRLDVDTGVVASSLAMAVLGAGLGAVMQVLVIAVQNAVDYADLGAATSGVTFLRSIGGSFGVAVFGAIFSNGLTGELARLLGPAAPAVLAEVGTGPDAVDALSPELATGYVAAYAASLQTVFTVAVPVALVAFVITWLMPEVPLRQTTGAGEQGDAFAMPRDRSSLQEVERAVCRLAGTENRPALYRRLAADATVDLDPVASWMLFRIEAHPAARTLEDLARRCGVPGTSLVVPYDQLVAAGYLDTQRPTLTLTLRGARAAARLVEARREGLRELLAGWSPEQHPELAERLRVLARELLVDDPDRTLVQEATAGPPP